MEIGFLRAAVQIEFQPEILRKGFDRPLHREKVLFFAERDETEFFPLFGKLLHGKFFGDIYFG